MKIATNVHRDAFGGITISNLALFDWLEKKQDTIVGIEILVNRHFLGPIIFRRYEPSFFKHHIINAIDIIPKYSWEKGGNMRKKWSALIETAKEILRLESPDILLINGTYHTPWILAQAAKDLGIPIVLRYAGVLQKEISNKNFFVRKRLLSFEKWIASSASAIIFPSELCRRTVEKIIFEHPIKHSHIIPNPVIKHFAKKPHGDGRFTIATVGRWAPVKNFKSFIALHEKLLKENWPHRAIMITSFRGKVTDLPETIEQRPPMSHDDLIKFYQSIDLLIVPSHFETFCNVAAEAVAAGASVLVSKNIGFSEILIKAGLKRMIVNDFNNTQETASAVKNIPKKKISRAEAKKVIALLEPGRIHKNILNILKHVIDNEI